MVDHGLRPPEFHSVRLHLAPGAGSFFALADALAGAAAQLSGIGGGYQATAGALSAAWMGPASEVAIAADLPHQAWMGDVVAQIGTAGAQIAAAGAAFEAAKAATPAPVEIAEHQLEHLVLLATNFLGINTVAIILNRLRYFEMWIRTATAMVTYEAASAATVGSLPVLPPPPPGVAAAAGDPLAEVEQALQKPVQQLMQGAEAAWGSVQGPLSAIAPFALPVGMGLLSAAPMAMAVPMMGMSAVMPLASQLGRSGGLAGASAHAGDAANTGSWMGATPEPGGPVAANLSSGGGGGGPGSTATAMAPLRSPGSWASSSTAAAPAAESDAGQVSSRIAEAREAATRPATGAGMGTPGAMAAPPVPRGSESEQKPQQRNSPLVAAAALYREPTQIPVVTGADGARFVAGEEDR